MTDKPLTDVTFSSFDLHPRLQDGLVAAGFTRLTPIQALTLPVALPGGDVAGQAQTGTGKTLAFLVAVMNRLLTRPALSDRKPEDPRALILAPTRELAIQIHKDAIKFGPELGLRFALVYGGVDYDKQRQLLQEGVDVIIATPGRLIDYVKQHKVVSLHACEICVLDEADRMFDLGFIKDIRFLLRRMPVRTERQTLLFSATLSHRVLELAYEHMNEPQKMVVETETITAALVRQKLYYPSDEEKLPLLLGLLSRGEGARTMVFVNTKVFVERVARALERAGYRVGVLSGDVPQKRRESLLKKFQAGQLEILVATDVAARGLHIDGVKYVYNYDLPFDAEDYVHRIGRTARLGEEGDAISFACERYAIGLPDIEAFIEQKIPSEPVSAELLKALPRKPREGVELEPEEGESVSEIFREAREQRAADDARRGGGRREGGTDRARPARSEASGEARRERGPRKPRAPRADDAAVTGAGNTSVAEADAGGHPGVNTGMDTGVDTGAAVEAGAGAHDRAAASDAAAGTDAERAPRKRRRRRGGRRVNGEGQPVQEGQAQEGQARNEQAPGAGKQAAASQPRAPRTRSAPKAPVQSQAAPASRPAAETSGQSSRPATGQPAGQPSLIGRIGQGLRKLVTRAPRSQH